MSGIGHNNGPTMEAGYGWRKHSWSKARRDLLPTLPIEVLRRRVARAKELGLPYKTYASVRAASGHDVVAFLFSSNALRVFRDGAPMPAHRAQKLLCVKKASLTTLAQPPLDPARLIATLMSEHGVTLKAADRAPHFAASWSDIRDAVAAPLRAAGIPRDGVLVVGDTDAERDWCAAGRLAGFISSDVQFGLRG